MLRDRCHPARSTYFNWNPDPKPRRCAKCGKEFLPNSKTAKYCEVHRSKKR